MNLRLWTQLRSNSSSLVTFAHAVRAWSTADKTTSQTSTSNYGFKQQLWLSRPMEKTIWLKFRFCWMYHGWPWWLNKFWNQEGHDKKGARKYWAQKIGVGLKLPSRIHILSFFNTRFLLRSMDNRDLESSISAILIMFPQCRLDFNERHFSDFALEEKLNIRHTSKCNSAHDFYSNC